MFKREEEVMNKNKRAIFDVAFLIVIVISVGFVIAGAIQRPVPYGIGQSPKAYQADSYYTEGDYKELKMNVAWPTSRFEMAGNCVKDTRTGLIWAKDANFSGDAMPYQRAVDYVVSLNSGEGLCGYRDWRLPHVNELKDIINEDGQTASVWIKRKSFNDLQTNYYWSFSPYTYHTDFASVVDMNNGGVYTFHKALNFYVWPVRNG